MLCRTMQREGAGDSGVIIQISEGCSGGARDARGNRGRVAYDGAVRWCRWLAGGCGSTQASGEGSELTPGPEHPAARSR